MHRAGGIHQLATGLKQGQQSLQQLLLQGNELLDGPRGHAPAGIGMAGQGAQARAGGIQQDAIKTGAPLGLGPSQATGIGRQNLDGLQTQAGPIDLHPPQPGRRAINGPNLALVAHQLSQMGGFTPRSCAGIQDALAGLGVQQQGHPLGSAILHAPLAFGVAGQPAQITAAAHQGEGQGQALDHLGPNPGCQQLRLQLVETGLDRIDAQIQAGRQVAGQTKGLGLLQGQPLQHQGSQPIGQGMAHPKGLARIR